LVLGVFTAVGTVAALVFPPWIHRTSRPRLLVTGVVVVSTVCLVVLALFPVTATWVLVVVFGLVTTGWFTMGLTLIGMVSRDGHEAARITAMAYTCMYLLGAIGPIACGALLSLTGSSWESLFLSLAVVSALGFTVIPKLANKTS
jgi:CP family cyanate transporter-like MFS transporter